ncbi:MAG: TonB-dependent receptor, partial [Bacteroidota bacterium]
LMPDQDGDAIGGSVDLSSPKARRPQLGLKAELGTGYNGLSDGFNAIGRLSVGKRFGVTEANKNGKFGILLSGSYYGTDNGEDRTESEWRPQDIEPENGEDSEAFLLYTHDLRGLTTQRTRSGLGASLDYQFNPTNFITGRVLYSALEEDEIRSRTRYRPRNGTYRSATFNEGGRVRKTFRDRTVNRYTTSINLNGTFAVGNLKITPGFAYSETERDEDGRRNQFELRGVDMNITEADTEAPQFTPAGDVSFRDPAAYERWDNYRIYNTLVSATTTTTKIDFEYPIKVGKNLLTLKTGYKRRTSEKTQDSDQNFFEYDGDTDGLFASFVADGLLTEDYLNGQVDFGPAISPDLVREFYEANSADFEANLEDKLEDETTFFYDAEETTDALYLMAKYRVGNLLLIGGLRNESVDVVYNAREYVEPEDEDAFARPSMGGSNYSFLLPNLQLKYELNRLTNLRLAYTTGYARPNFRDLVPSFQVDLEGEELSTGNPDLRPPSSTNLDLMFERYLGTVGILSGGLFYKRIEDFRFVRNLSIITGEEFDGAERYLDFEAEIADNGEEATVFGIELNAQTNLKFLPGALSGLGLYLNYTYTTSDAFTAERTDIRLPGQAPHTLNGALTYDLGGFSGRINVNFQDERLQSIGGDRGGVGENDIIRAARTQVDVNASYTFARRWRVYAEAINITNAAQIDFWGNSSRTASTAYFSWWSRVGVGYSF